MGIFDDIAEGVAETVPAEPTATADGGWLADIDDVVTSGCIAESVEDEDEGFSIPVEPDPGGDLVEMFVPNSDGELVEVHVRADQVDDLVDALKPTDPVDDFTDLIVRASADDVTDVFADDQVYEETYVCSPEAATDSF